VLSVAVGGGGPVVLTRSVRDMLERHVSRPQQRALVLPAGGAGSPVL